MNKHVASENGWWTKKDWVLISVASCLHITLALYFRFVHGLRFENNTWNPTWDSLVQYLPAHLLQEDLLASLYYLHVQPPLMNLIGGVLMLLSPENYPVLLSTLYVGFGAGITVLSYVFFRTVRIGFLGALGGAVFISANPALLAYEGYPLYAVPTAFFVMLIATTAMLYERTKKEEVLIFFFYMVSLLILLRSAYQLPFFLIVFCLRPTVRSRRYWLHLILSFSLCFGWYLKNYFLYGVFTSSTFTGGNLFHVAAFGYSRGELLKLSQRGVIDPITLETNPLSHPQIFYEHGLYVPSKIRQLRGPNLNALVMVEVHKIFFRSALNLIKHDLFRFLKALRSSYYIYTRASGTFVFNLQNYDAVGFLGKLYDRVAVLGLPAEGPRWRLVGSWFGVLIPLVIIRLAWGKMRGKDFPGSSAILFLICYSVLSGVAGDIGENVRFRFDIESIILILSLRFCTAFILPAKIKMVLP